MQPKKTVHRIIYGKHHIIIGASDAIVSAGHKSLGFDIDNAIGLIRSIQIRSLTHYPICSGSGPSKDHTLVGQSDRKLRIATKTGFRSRAQHQDDENDENVFTHMLKWPNEKS